MQKHLYKSLSILAVAIFVLYWAANIQLSVFGQRRSFVGSFSFDNLIVYRWRFFAPVPADNNQVCFYLRDRTTKAMTDSIDIIDEVDKKKRANAPFNQQENVLDHMLFHAVAVVKKAVWHYGKQVRADMPGMPDSIYYKYSVDHVLKDSSCVGQLISLRNFCEQLLSQKHIDTTGKEYRMIILQKNTIPFDERNNASYIPSSTVYFETVYKPFDK